MTRLHILPFWIHGSGSTKYDAVSERTVTLPVPPQPPKSLTFIQNNNRMELGEAQEDGHFSSPHPTPSLSPTSTTTGVEYVINYPDRLRADSGSECCWKQAYVSACLIILCFASIWCGLWWIDTTATGTAPWTHVKEHIE
jgi:hypothetical protein